MRLLKWKFKIGKGPEDKQFLKATIFFNSAIFQQNNRKKILHCRLSFFCNLVLGLPKMYRTKERLKFGEKKIFHFNPRAYPWSISYFHKDSWFFTIPHGQ